MSDLSTVSTHSKSVRRAARPYVWFAIGAIALAGIVWAMRQRKAEDFKVLPLSFLSAPQTAELLRTDFDDFAKKLNTVNLEACGVVSYEDLLDKWATSASDFTEEEQRRLREAAKLVDYTINTKLKSPLKEQMQSLGWQFAKTTHPYYLDGLPHTRGDLIFLTDKVTLSYDPKRLAQILLHEKVHLWQRKFPQDLQAYLQRHSFQPLRLDTEDALQRMNPDTDGVIYQNAKGDVLGVRYTSPTPFSLRDVHYDLDKDHPNEQMASRVEKLVL